MRQPSFSGIDAAARTICGFFAALAQAVQAWRVQIPAIWPVVTQALLDYAAAGREAAATGLSELIRFVKIDPWNSYTRQIHLNLDQAGGTEANEVLVVPMDSILRTAQIAGVMVDPYASSQNTAFCYAELNFHGLRTVHNLSGTNQNAFAQVEKGFFYDGTVSGQGSYIDFSFNSPVFPLNLLISKGTMIWLVLSCAGSGSGQLNVYADAMLLFDKVA